MSVSRRGKDEKGGACVNTLNILEVTQPDGKEIATMDGGSTTVIICLFVYISVITSRNQSTVP